ncbi:MAG: phosphotransferase [Actinomycetota bacterium]|nr:phosphotransferase [Actinomycetota bacterium]
MEQTVSVPDSLEELLTPEWLSAALGVRYPGIKVSAVRPGPVISRVSTNARFEIDCEGGLPEGLSPNLCAKGYFGETGRQYRSAGTSEALFYRDLVGSIPIRTLRSVYADVDPATGHGVVLTEDVAVEGAVFLDGRERYSPEQTAASLEQYAALHGSTWNSPAVGRAEWLGPRIASSATTRGVKEIRGNFEGPIGAGVPDAARDAARLMEAFTAIPRYTESLDHWSLLLGDAHIGNLILDAEGRPWLVDWQLVQRGPWFLDVGYHIASALTVEDRRRHEQDLVEQYLARLVEAGGERPSDEEIRIGLCCGIVYGFFLWGITLKVDPAITAVRLERLGAAVADHDAFSVVLDPEHRPGGGR